MANGTILCLFFYDCNKIRYIWTINLTNDFCGTKQNHNLIIKMKLIFYKIPFPVIKEGIIFLSRKQFSTFYIKYPT